MGVSSPRLQTQAFCFVLEIPCQTLKRIPATGAAWVRQASSTSETLRAITASTSGFEQKYLWAVGDAGALVGAGMHSSCNQG